MNVFKTSINRRLIGSIALVTLMSLFSPSLLLSIMDAASPRFSPEQFNLPVTAREVVRKRTDKTATFEVGDGKYAQVSGIERGILPACQTILCSFLEPIRNFLPSVFATSAGPNSPGTMADNATVGTNAWSNPDSAKTSNDTYATASDTSEGNAYSHYLMAKNFVFTIPDGSTIDGIVVQFERKGNSVIGRYIRDSEIKIIKADGSIGSTNKADTLTNWVTVENYFSYGGSSDLWGETDWTSAGINDADFGVVLSVLLISSAGIATASVDHIRITVYYTEAATPVPFFSWWSVPLLIAGLFMIFKKEGMFSHFTISHG